MSEDDISMGEIGGLLADIRDMFPVPECGSELEVAWAGAIASPEGVPAYVKECVAKMQEDNMALTSATLTATNHIIKGLGKKFADVGKPTIESLQLENANILRASLDSADLARQALETVAEQASEIAALKACLSKVRVPVAKQPAPNDAWCVGCNPDNCSGCGT